MTYERLIYIVSVFLAAGILMVLAAVGARVYLKWKNRKTPAAKKPEDDDNRWLSDNQRFDPH